MLVRYFSAFLIAIVVTAAGRSNSALAQAAATPPAPNDQSTAGKDMTALLSALAARMDAFPTDYNNDAKVAHLEKLLEQPLAPQDRLHTQFLLAEELLKAGRTEDAIKGFNAFLNSVESAAPQIYARSQTYFKTRLAIAYLRLGEQNNCIHHHNPDSCLFPIANSGVHANREGSLKARALLEELLRKDADYLPARWLLGIASMTLGDYPESVPEAWRFPSDAFQSEHDIKRFPDIAAKVGLGVDGLAGGVCMEDFDNDGYLDLIASSWGYTHQLRYFRNTGDGSFSDLTESAGLTGIIGGLNLIHADYDNDGDTDVFILRGAWHDTVGEHPNSLLRNNGDNTFTDVTRKSGVLSFRPTQTAAWFDYDNDGWLDLFIANESNAAAGSAFECELFHNNRDGFFTDVAAGCRVNFRAYLKAVVAGDFNNDGRPDLYISNVEGPNLLLRNDGPRDPDHPDPTTWRFTEIAAHAGVQRPTISFPSWFWDFDNDGWQDLLVLDYDGEKLPDIIQNYLDRPMRGEGMKLYRNRGDGRFEDVTNAAGLHRAMLAMGSNFGDLDNDGWLDFYVGTGAPDLGAIFPNRMFRNAGGKRFQDVTTSGGFGHLQKGHGVAFGDLDNDGDQDVYAVMGGAYTGDSFFNALFYNPGHGNGWIKLKLIGTQSNRSAIGARLKLTILENGVERSIHRVVGSGGSFGANPLLQEIGLGKATIVKRLEIAWPTSGATQSFDNVAPGMLHTITEGKPELASRKPTPIAFSHK